MFCVFILIFVFVAKADGFFFGNSGGGGGGCSCPPAPPPPVCQQQACPPPPSCGPPPQQFVPQFQPQVPFQGQGFLPPPPPPPPQFPPQQNLIPQGGFGNGGYAVNQGPPPVQPGPPQQNFVPYEQPPPPPPPPAVQIPSPVPATNNENYDYEHFAQKTSDSYASNEQQVEVEPSARNAEQPLDESDPNNVFLPGKTLKKTPSKPSKKIRPPPLDHSFDEDFFNSPTTTRAPATITTTTTTTTTPAPPKTTTLEDIYDDDKLPDIDDEYYENSRNAAKNTTTKNMTNDRYMPLKKLKSDILTNDYSENSFKTKVAGVRSRIASELTDDNKCGDPFLRRIMTENIVASPTISKQLIFTAGKQHYNKSIDVVCSKNKFSYTVVSTKVFCEVTVKPVTCFAFFQPANLKKHRRHV